jgi:hypothetical protein
MGKAKLFVVHGSSLYIRLANSKRLYRLRKKGPTLFVIPSEARNLSFFSAGQIEERFLASLGMTK